MLFDGGGESVFGAVRKLYVSWCKNSLYDLLVRRQIWSRWSCIIIMTELCVDVEWRNPVLFRDISKYSNRPREERRGLMWFCNAVRS